MEYQFDAEIGVGAFGRVFRATCLKTYKQVAIKYVDLVGAGKSRLVALCREIKILKFLKDEPMNIFALKLLDAYFPTDTDLTDDSPTIRGVYLVTEFLEFTLGDLLEKKEPNLTR